MLLEQSGPELGIKRRDPCRPHPDPDIAWPDDWIRMRHALKHIGSSISRILYGLHELFFRCAYPPASE